MNSDVLLILLPAGPAANTWGWLLSVIFVLCVSLQPFLTS